MTAPPSPSRTAPSGAPPRGTTASADGPAYPLQRRLLRAKVGTHGTTPSAVWVPTAALCILVGGTVSFACFETVVTTVPGTSFIVTVFQFLSAAAMNFSPAHLTRRTMPLFGATGVLAVVAATLGSNVLANAAIDLGLPLPVYLIARNLNLIATTSLAWLLQGRRFTWQQVAAVVTVTVAVVVTVLMFSRPSAAAAAVSGPSGVRLTLGVMSVLASLVCVSLSGVLQDKLFATHGRSHTSELLFWTHAIGLPCLLPFVGASPSRQAWALASARVQLGAVSLPLLGVLLGNLAAGCVCKWGVLTLMSAQGAVPATLTITIYRLMALLVSVLVLSPAPAPPAVAWLAVACVFVGSAAYVAAPNPNPKCCSGPSTRRRLVD